MSFESALKKATGKGLRAARQNLIPMLMLEGAMALLVVVYYFWPTGEAVLTHYAAWQQKGGILVAALATAVAGGVISELSLVYFQDEGHWNRTHLENMGFKLLLFCISGATVYEFYQWQAVWFGQGNTWSVILPKVCVDQFGYTVLWAVPYMTLATRWQALRYSGKSLWAELDKNFIPERMLPILITNWMFWIPGVCLIYSMPLILQTPLFIFATAIWGILLPAVGRQSEGQAKGVAQTPVMALPTALGHPVE